MQLPGPLLPAHFVDRPNRFLAVVELEGREILAHLPDPGRLTELLVPGAKVWVRPAHSHGRKTGFTLSLVEAPDGEVVSVVTILSNELVREALRAKRLSELSEWEVGAREYVWGRSRFDFLLGSGAKRLLLEVKSVTLVADGRALFPDAVSERGARQLRELAMARDKGFEAAVVFVVQRRGASSVAAARAIDPRFADAMGEAAEAGVKLLGYRCEVSLGEARITEPLPVLVSR